jgi:hypothetical protein
MMTFRVLQGTRAGESLLALLALLALLGSAGLASRQSLLYISIPTRALPPPPIHLGFTHTKHTNLLAHAVTHQNNNRPPGRAHQDQGAV